MATQKLNLTRDQLATFLKNHEQIKQFERLFALADEVAPASDTQGISIQAGNADAAANEALAQLVRLAQDAAINSGNADQKAVQALDMLQSIANVLEMLATAPVIQNNNSVVTDYADFNTTTPAPAIKVGRMYWDGGTTLGVQMTTNVLGRVLESQYVYVKASSAITKGQLCYHTGAVGSSGVITAAPTPLALADPNQIVGVAAESIALNAFGLIQISGDLRGFNTSGSSVGETWTDGDPLYYNPFFVGSMTKVKPSAPNQKTYIGEVINAGSGGSGSIHIRIVPGSVLGGTDSNVQFGTLANNDLIQYDSTLGYWKNVPASTLPVGTATNLAGGAAGSVPYQSAPGTTTFLPIGTALQVLKVNVGATAPEWVSGAALTKTDDTNVTLTLGGTPATSLLAATSLTLGWSGQLAVGRGGTGVATATANYVFAGPTSGGAAAPSFRALVSGDIPALPYVSSVSGTAGRITSTGGTTPVIDLASGVATPGTTGSSTLIPVITIDTYGRVTSISTAANPQGTVTSVAALTLGTSGTDLSSTVANSTTTPVITLNVPTASATNRGALSSTDWTTFNNKEPAIAAGTTAQYWRGDKTWQDFAAAVRATVLTGLSTATNAIITAADTVLSALGKLQAQITANLSTLTSHTSATGTAVHGLGTMSTQNANSVAITGGSINGTTVGASTAATGKFTSLAYSELVASAGLNIKESGTWNDNLSHSFSSWGAAWGIAYITSGNGVTVIPWFSNGGGGVGYLHNILDPDAGTWVYGNTVTFTSVGSTNNTYSFTVSNGAGQPIIQRTGGTNSYTVYIAIMGR